MTADIAALDVPTASLESQMKQLIARQRRQAVIDTLDGFARLACEHPEACTCADDAPAEWAARIAELATRNKTFGVAS